MRRQQHSQSWLFRLATRAVKYFLLGLAGCTVTYVMAWVFNLEVVACLMIWLLERLAVRSLVLVFCLGTMAVITESLRS
ncbi:MAG: hypothetical protein F6K00_04035 [Leptolyngbya sp. SIOISBB]|nr:hypothetical protein [Leptolyngbya sp. SIOISBB]